MYTLRFPFELQPAYEIGIEGIEAFECRGHPILLNREGSTYVLTVKGFESETEARDYLANIRSGLTWLLLNRGVSIDASYNPQEVFLADDPAEAARNLSQSFGGLDLGDEVHGLLDNNRPAIYPSDGNFKVISAGKASIRQTASPADVIDLLAFGMSVRSPEGIGEDERLWAAFDLYSAFYGESSVRARFLTLVMVLESLTEPSLRPPIIQDMVDRFAEIIDESLVDVDDGSAETFALEALRREIDPHRRRNSIRASLREMILTVLADDEDSDDVAQRAVDIYDKRSRLVHGGSIQPNELSRLTDEVRQIVHRLLKVHFLQATCGNPE